MNVFFLLWYFTICILMYCSAEGPFQFKFSLKLFYLKVAKRVFSWSRQAKDCIVLCRTRLFVWFRIIFVAVAPGWEVSICYASAFCFILPSVLGWWSMRFTWPAMTIHKTNNCVWIVFNLRNLLFHHETIKARNSRVVWTTPTRAC